MKFSLESINSIFKPAYEVVDQSVESYNESNPYIKLATIAKVCIGRYDCDMTEEEAKIFLKQVIIARSHEAALEHYWITVSIPGYFDLQVLSDIQFIQTSQCSGFITNIIGNIRMFRDLLRYGISHISVIDDAQRRMFADLAYVLTEQYSILFEDLQGLNSLQTRNGSYECKEYPRYWTFAIITNRGVLAEITRHRVFSFLVESTRYCNYSKHGILICNPAPYVMTKLWKKTINTICKTYMKMIKSGCKAQEARGILPNDLAVHMYMTGTLSQWQHFLALRTASDAHPHIKVIADMIDQKLPAISDNSNTRSTVGWC